MWVGEIWELGGEVCVGRRDLGGGEVWVGGRDLGGGKRGKG